MTRAHDQQGDAGALVSALEKIKALAYGGKTWTIASDALDAWNRRALSPPMTSPAAVAWRYEDALPGRAGKKVWRVVTDADSLANLRDAGIEVEALGVIAAQTSPAAGAVEREKVADAVLSACRQYADTVRGFAGKRCDVHIGYILDEATDAILSALSLVGGGGSPDV